MIQILLLAGAACFLIAGIGLVLGIGSGARTKNRAPLGIILLLAAAANIFFALRM
jgi:hypothetical protein